MGRSVILRFPVVKAKEAGKSCDFFGAQLVMTSIGTWLAEFWDVWRIRVDDYWFANG